MNYLYKSFGFLLMRVDIFVVLLATLVLCGLAGAASALSVEPTPKNVVRQHYAPLRADAVHSMTDYELQGAPSREILQPAESYRLQ